MYKGISIIKGRWGEGGRGHTWGFVFFSFFSLFCPSEEEEEEEENQ